jgi:hypothetical protein
MHISSHLWWTSFNGQQNHRSPTVINVFRNVMPYNLVKRYLLPTSTLKMEAAGSSETRRWICQPYMPAALYPQEESWYSFLLKDWVDPRTTMRLEGLCQLKKNPPHCDLIPRPTLPRAPCGVYHWEINMTVYAQVTIIGLWQLDGDEITCNKSIALWWRRYGKYSEQTLSH